MQRLWSQSGANIVRIALVRKHQMSASYIEPFRPGNICKLPDFRMDNACCSRMFLHCYEGLHLA